MCTYANGGARVQDRQQWRISGYDQRPEDWKDLIDEYNDPYYDLDLDMVINAKDMAARDPEAFQAKRRLENSNSNWIEQSFIQVEAAKTIQSFLRARGEGKIENLRSTGTTLSVESQDDEEDEKDEQYEVYVWYGTQLGLEFYSCNVTGFPCVDDPNGNESLPGMWNVRSGDYLISVNDCSTRPDSMPFDSVMQILEDGVRPAILRFRRPRVHEMQFRSSRSRKTSPISAAKREQQRRRERLERSLCYVVWREEDGPLGIVLKNDRGKPYPTVSDVADSGVVARESQGNIVQAGDLLLSINHMDVSSMGYQTSLEIMKFAPRPLVLTFRRSNTEIAGERSLEL
ncbi:hypothetical protein Poli38472_004264 [Pythium oligandrum]|uniref:PDZ domain-containing protein n=1 Tax=Pythium oligandrum TaxID=41045 RepID=A0A8K1CNS9_PYTOL|nr:hypothetical protein Poli38472_004264 [Pythium oligandrum]|eukprot:TMW66499.1 hypothetical protein Poli38472_004264 [Pythium oligandrum]